MKHSIKREQSHARMSFAECENVRATLKHMKLSFHLILTLAAMLAIAQTAWAGTTIETRTMTWPMNGTGASGSVLTNSAGNRLVLSKNSWQGNSTLGNRSYTTILTENYGLVGTEISFPDIVGKVTSVELTNVLFLHLMMMRSLKPTHRCLPSVGLWMLRLRCR